MSQPDDSTHVQPEADDMSRYVIAVRREKRQEIDPDWPKKVQAIPGIDIQTSNSSNRMMVLATETAVGLLKKEMGLNLYIEPVIDHKKSEED